jgi:hypothetical protein
MFQSHNAVYSGRAHGIEMKRDESRGNRLENRSYILLNNSALPSADPRTFRRSPMVFTLACLENIRENGRSMENLRHGRGTPMTKMKY